MSDDVPNRTGRMLIAGLGVLVLGAALVWSFWPARPASMALNLESHAATPAVKRMDLNGRRVVTYSVRGRSEGGEINYKTRWSDALDIDLVWYDISEKRTYAASVTVSASELSTFGDARENAALRVVTGPGADVTVSTTDPETARLIGLGDDVALAERPVAPPVVLRTPCGQALSQDHPLSVEFAGFFESILDGSDSEFYHYEDKMKARSVYLQDNDMPQSRCASEQSQ